jgi:hypothetical protein
MQRLDRRDDHRAMPGVLQLRESHVRRFRVTVKPDEQSLGRRGLHIDSGRERSSQHSQSS